MGMTLQSLTQAIQQHIDEEMDAEVAAGMAEHALGFFGFYNRIIDNALEPTDRNLFYMFQVHTCERGSVLLCACVSVDLLL